MRIKEAIGIVQGFLRDQSHTEEDKVVRAKNTVMIQELQEWQDWITEPDTITHRTDATGALGHWNSEDEAMGVRVEFNSILVWVKPGATKMVVSTDEEYGDVLIKIESRRLL